MPPRGRNCDLGIVFFVYMYVQYFIFFGCSQAWVGERVAQVVNFQQAVSLNLVARKQVAATALARQKGALLKQLSTSLTAVRQASFKGDTT